MTEPNEPQNIEPYVRNDSSADVNPAPKGSDTDATSDGRTETITDSGTDVRNWEANSPHEPATSTDASESPQETPERTQIESTPGVDSITKGR